MSKRVWAFILSAGLASAGLSGCGAVVVGGAAATGAAVAHDRRTPGTILEDQEIELRAIQLLHSKSDIKAQSNVDVTSYNLVVLITGQAASDDVSRRFAQLVSEMPKVRRVHNEVVAAAEATFTESSSDAYLTSKVKLDLFKVDLPDFDPSRVKVVTSQGTVYLMGLVTVQEADAVVARVRYLSGVQRVVKLFEYVELPPKSEAVAREAPPAPGFH